jgi:hypothetical protein
VVNMEAGKCEVKRLKLAEGKIRRQRDQMFCMGYMEVETEKEVKR